MIFSPSRRLVSPLFRDAHFSSVKTRSLVSLGQIHATCQVNFSNFRPSDRFMEDCAGTFYFQNSIIDNVCADVSKNSSEASAHKGAGNRR